MEFGVPKVGQTFSHYRLLSKLGEGGMGVVYAAEDLSLGRQVAVKFLRTGLHKRLARARFQREARSTSALSHPNIATVYDYGETKEGFPFIVMELLRGQTLSELMRSGMLTLERSVEIVSNVLEALGEAHRHGIVHRDIKPSNIVVGEQGQVKVLDFGLAKSLWGENARKSDSGPNLLEADPLADLPTQTLTGTVLGTPLYVSPEQATSSAVDQRSDLFSIGAVLYECLAGRPAFAAPSVVEIFAQVINPVPPPLPSSFNHHVPAELDRITLKAITKSVERRYQSAEEFLEQLRRVRLPQLATGVIPKGSSQVLGGSLDSLYRKILSRGDEPHTRAHLLKDSLNWPKHLRRWRPVWFTTLVIIIALILFFGLRTRNGKIQPLNSIAVIPFANEGKEEGLEYLTDGLTDSMIFSLSQLPDLKVISRSSVMKYKGQEVNLNEIEKSLNVNAVLTGRVRRNGDELQVVVEFIKVSDGSLIWGAQYQKKFSDILAVQQEIATEIAGKLRRKLNDQVTIMLSKRMQVNPAAYDFYLKGRWQWNKRTGESVTQAINYFQQAIDLEPTYALAYAGLADAYALNSMVRPEESYMRAKAAAAKALEYDETLGEAHATLGFIRSHYEKNWTDADKEFQQAIALNPNYATAHHWYADALMVRGKIDSAAQELRLAQELDPLSPIINTDVGLCYFYARQYDQAETHFKRMTELFPDFFPAHFYLGWTYTQKLMYSEAIEQYQKALSLTQGRHTMVMAMLGYTYAKSGRETEARNILKELDSLTTRQYVSPYRFAILYAGLGQKDLALQWLNRANDELDILLIYVNVSPFFDSIREDPRFNDLLRRISLASS